MPTKKQTIWICVGNGAGFRVFSSPGLGGDLEQIATWASPDARKLTRELGAERPGRSQAAPGQARHGYANKEDWHQQAEKETAKKMSDYLNRKHHANKFDRVVVIAPPKTLGQVRPALKFRDQPGVVREYPKDLANLSIHELKSYLEKNL